MADYFVAISEDGVRFKLKSDGTWEPDTTPQSEDAIRFRTSNWGNSIVEVKDSEQAEPLFEDTEALMYEVSIGGFPAKLVYRFVNGMLCKGIYRFEQEHAEKNSFIEDFETLKKLLTLKYGEPFEVNDFWLNDLYKDDYSARGLAVSCGHRAMFSLWQDADTTITLQITGDNYEIGLRIFYTSKRLESLEAAASERAKLDGL